MSNLPDVCHEELISRSRDGDPDAVARLIDEHRPQLHAFCARFRDDPYDREELAQLVMIRIWRGIARFDARSSFTTWLFQIVRNTAATEYDRRSRSPVPVDLSRDDTVPFGILARAGVEDVVVLRDSLGQAFGRLDDRLRTAVELVDVWGCPQAEAAQLCGVPEATVRTRLWRARRCLRSTLTEDVA